MDSKIEALEREPTLEDYLRVLWRRWWLIAATSTVGLIIALVVSLAAPLVYRASATIVVDRASASLGLLPDITGLSQQTSVDTLAEIARSRTVAERALDRLRVPEGERDRALRRLQSGLRVQRVRGADLIRIEAEGLTPQGAAENANAVAEAFIAWHIDSRRAQAAAGREFVESQLAKVDRELRPAEDALARYKAKGGQVSLSEQTSLAVTKLAEFEAQRRALAAEREAIEASLRQARATLARQEPTIRSSFLTAEDPVVGQLRQELAKLEVEHAGLREQFTDRHPQVIAIRARIEEIKTSLRQLATARLASQTATVNPLRQDLAGQVIKLEVERQALRAREGAVAAIVNRYAQDVQTLPPKEVQLARLTRDFKVADQTFLLLSQKLQEAKIAEASIVGDLRLVDRSVPPTAPVKPRPNLNAFLGVFIGFVLGVAGVYALEALDTTFKSPEEVAQVLGLPVLATIPLWRRSTESKIKKEIPVAVGEHRRSPFAEAFRHLRTNLLYLSPDRALRTLQITSPGPGEGKTTVAANLAIALTQLGKRVWLVECDLRKPTLAWTFQPKTAFGLSELLVDSISVDQALHQTTVENLWFLPSGMKPPNPAELLGSQKLRALLNESPNGADLIVLDAPPVLPVTDASVLAPAVDGVLLVVQIGRTPREAAHLAHQQLKAVGARVLGVVVNGVSPSAHTGYYYYSDYYESEPKEPETAKRT